MIVTWSQRRAINADTGVCCVHTADKFTPAAGGELRLNQVLADFIESQSYRKERAVEL